MRCCLVIAVFGLAVLRADPRPPEDFVHRSIEQGLSQSSVQAIVQDHTGYLWIGTEEGLNRYDGYTFRVFRHDPHDPHSLPDDLVSALFEDSQHRLWIGTQRGLCRYDPGTETFTVLPQVRDRVQSLVESADGTVWIASQGGGLFLLPAGSDVLASYLPDARFPWSSLSSYSLSTLYFDRRGRLWIGTHDHGLDLFVPGKPFGSFVHHAHDPAKAGSLAGDDVWGIAEDSQGRLLVATYGQGLDRWNEARGEFEHLAGGPAGPGSGQLTGAFVDHAGTCWVGSDGAGLLRWDEKSGRLVGSNGGPKVIRSLCEDRQGHLWLGSFQDGIYELKTAREGFTFYPGAGPVASVLEDRSGRIWIGTEHGEMLRYDGARGTLSPIPAASGGPAALALFEDSRHRIWSGTYKAGLRQFDPQTGTMRPARIAPGHRGLGNDQVWSIAEGSNGTLWLATDGGVDQYDPDQGGVVAHFGPGPSDQPGELSVRSVLVDRSGTLWIGSFGGLAALRPGAVALERFHDDAPAAVISLHEDDQGRLWAGTLGGGLKRFDPATGRFRTFQAFPSNVIYAVEEEPAGILWLSTNQGLIRFNVASEAFTSYDLTNGLQMLQFHLGASRRLQDGRLLFGSVDGLSSFDPSRISPDRFVPPVVITQVRIAGGTSGSERAEPPEGAVRLSPADRLLSVDFAALDFNFPKRNRYSYTMEGLTRGWIDLGVQREVTFTNLPPGSYSLRVRASNSDGIWTEASQAALRLEVAPPFYATLGFRALLVAAALLALYGVHRRRVRALSRDLERRRETEAVLRRAEEKYRDLVEEIGEVIFSANPEGKITYISPVAERLMDCAPSDLIGAGLDQIIGATALGELLSAIANPAAERTVVGEHQLPGRDGEPRFLRISTRLILTEGRLTGLRGVITDVTELKRLETQVRQAQKMDAIGQLAGGIAHDFNNILTAIIAYTDLLLGEQLSEAAREAGLKEIRGASQRAATLTKQLLAFSRQQVLQPQIVDVNLLLMEMEKMLQRLIGDNILLALVLDPRPAVVRADPGQVQQIILNLALNARDAMPQGGRLLVQTADHAAEGFPEVMLLVSDTGTGMTSQVKARLFEPFFTTKSVGKGTGLGLSTVYGIVRQSNGRIDVSTTEGKGSSFRVYLPRAGASPPAAANLAAVAPPAGIGTLLVVEDNESVAGVLRKLLANAGREVIFAANAEEALELCEKRGAPIDLLITDVVMPGRSGRDLAQELRKLYPRLRILFMSGYADDVLARQGSLPSPHRFLQKPFTQDELFREMIEALR